jgi:DnaJ family protein C protein 8
MSDPQPAAVAAAANSDNKKEAKAEPPQEQEQAEADNDAKVTASSTAASEDSASTPTADPVEEGGGEEEVNNEDDETAEEWEIQRDHHKAQGDLAFRCGGFKTAIDEYSKAISLDPEYIVAYSNRSAAYLRNSEKSKALKDATYITSTLDPTFAKGQSRLAAALHALRRFEQAKDAYHAVLALDPNNAAATRGVEECQKELDRIQQHEDEEEEKPKAKKAPEQPQVQPQAEDQPEEEEEEEDDDGDDLLNDFFADVEVAAKKKKALSAEEDDDQPKATNAVKKDKQVLGTSEAQMERLLKDNHEWRNLNPFYVLQVTADATDDDVSRRYKALSLLLHPDKNGGCEQAQLAFDEVKKAKNLLLDPDRGKHTRMLHEEGMKAGEIVWKKAGKKGGNVKKRELQETEVMRIFAQVEQKRREVEQRERNYEQRERQQEDDELAKERKARKFDKQWRDEERVGKRVGNWRDFAVNKKKKV